MNNFICKIAAVCFLISGYQAANIPSKSKLPKKFSSVSKDSYSSFQKKLIYKLAPPQILESDIDSYQIQSQPKVEYFSVPSGVEDTGSYQRELQPKVEYFSVPSGVEDTSSYQRELEPKVEYLSVPAGVNGSDSYQIELQPKVEYFAVPVAPAVVKDADNNSYGTYEERYVESIVPPTEHLSSYGIVPEGSDIDPESLASLSMMVQSLPELPKQ